MRQETLFDRLRGHDGRSLARALVVLVLLGVFGAGLNAGAAASLDTALCLVDDAGGKAPPPGHDHEPDCCILGPTPFGAALVYDPPATTSPVPQLVAAVRPEGSEAITGRAPGRATARGPPLEP